MTVTFHALQYLLLQFEVIVTARKKGNNGAVDDEEYDVMIKKIFDDIHRPLSKFSSKNYFGCGSHASDGRKALPLLDMSSNYMKCNKIPANSKI